MKIGLIGRSEWMYNTAILLLKLGFEINFIVTSKESPEYKYSLEDFERFSYKNKIKFLNSNNIVSPSTMFFLNENKCDIVLSVNYSAIIPKQVIEIFPLGILNAHGGDLPRYRGNACQAWAIINGEKEIGLCIHKMIGGEIDSGDIIAKSYFKIENKRIGQIYNWMDDEIPRLFLDSIKKLQQNNDYKLEEQSTNYQDVLRCYPRKPEDGLIDWSQNADSVVRLINASSEPYSGAFTYYLDEKLIIWRASVFNDNERYLGVYGQITYINKNDGSIIVLTGNNTKIKIEVIEYEGLICSPDKLFKSLRIRL